MMVSVRDTNTYEKQKNKQAFKYKEGIHMIPTITKMEVFPVAGHDCMELNLSGAHAPYFTRNIVILTDSEGNEGIGEAPGGEKITEA